MAGDWIKMRVILHTHPKVVRIVSAVCPQDVRKVSARCLIVGALHAMWCLFDAHSDDGKLHGYTPETLDAVVGLDGFSVAVESVGWLVIAPNYLEMPNFGTHNGKGAKRRAEDTEAKRVRRLSEKCPQDLRTESGPEKRREEKIFNTYAGGETPPGEPLLIQGTRVDQPPDTPEPKPAKSKTVFTPAFNEFWSAYPPTRKVDRTECMKLWRKHNLDDPDNFGKLMRSLERWKACPMWTADGGQYVRAPAVWLRKENFKDTPPRDLSAGERALYARPTDS